MKKFNYNFHYIFLLPKMSGQKIFLSVEQKQRTFIDDLLKELEIWDNDIP